MQNELIIVSEYCRNAIHHLLQRMEEMQNELHELRSQLRLFR